MRLIRHRVVRSMGRMRYLGLQRLATIIIIYLKARSKLPMGMMRAADRTPCLSWQCFKDCSTSLLTISSMSAEMRRSSSLNSGDDRSIALTLSRAVSCWLISYTQIFLFSVVWSTTLSDYAFINHESSLLTSYNLFTWYGHMPYDNVCLLFEQKLNMTMKTALKVCRWLWSLVQNQIFLCLSLTATSLACSSERYYEKTV